MYGAQIAQIIKDTHEGVYGKSQSISNVFAGGNVGMIAIALGLSQMAFSIDRLTQEIQKNGFPKEKPIPKSPKKPKK